MIAMIGRPPSFVRENFPLLGVGAILLATFAALALFGGEPAGRANPGDALRQAVAPAQAGLAALPATAEDTVVLSELAPGDARARNAAVGFAAVGPGNALGFVFKGSAADRSRAGQCLALAALAEAGAGDADQRAVMQVVLNRVRHPAFAKTICGVVFEGSERTTGCQFSFTCDGSLARTYPESLWRAARRRADEALGGRVDASVGNATHFHTDWVYPWWSPELDKVARVGTHLFFRWRGLWGRSAALTAPYRGGEPDPLALQNRAAQVERPEDIWPRLVEDGAPVRSITAPSQSAPEPVLAGSAGSPAPGVHFVLVSDSDAPDSLVERARALCPGTRFCQVYGWDDVSAMPARLPLTPAARAALRFSFLPARDENSEAIYFDCRTYPSPAIGSCLPKARP